jgi:hypothetical protein
LGHRLLVDRDWTSERLQDAITAHVTEGKCALYKDNELLLYCQTLSNEMREDKQDFDPTMELQIRILTTIVDKITAVPLCRILHLHEVLFDKTNSTSQLCRWLCKHICTQGKIRRIQIPPMCGKSEKKKIKIKIKI